MEIKNCSCKREHICTVEQIISGTGSLAKLKGLLTPYKKVLAVSDVNTRVAFTQAGGAICGENIVELVFPDRHLIPNELAIARIEDSLNGAEAIVGIGGGTINDLCKFLAHKHGLYYIYVASAPSMDGYASDGAALILGGMKVTLKAIPPHCIICDADLLKNAPMELIKAGVGDILGKYSCLNDWRLAAYIKGEYICEEICARVEKYAETVALNAEKILRREGEAVMLLAEALTQVGVEMSYAGSSRPASGSEHHMAHFFEIYAIEHGKGNLPHGIDVGYSAYYTALLRDYILKSEKPFSFKHDKELYEQAIRYLFPKSCDGILQLQEKTAYHGNGNGNYNLADIKEILKQAPTALQMQNMLEKAGFDIAEFEAYYGKAHIETALKYGKELKDRFTVLWLYEYMGGMDYELLAAK